MTTPTGCDGLGPDAILPAFHSGALGGPQHRSDAASRYLVDTRHPK